MTSLSSRLDLVHEGIQKCQTATEKVERLKTHSDPAIKELASAIHFLAFGVQEIGLAISDQGRVDNLPIQQSR